MGVSIDTNDARFVGTLEPQLREAARSDLDVLVSGGSDRLRRLVPRLVHHWSDRRALPFIVLEPDRIALPARGWVLPKLPRAGSILIAEITALSTESQFFLGQLLEQRARRRDTGRRPRRPNDTRADLGSPMNQPRLFASTAAPADDEAAAGRISSQLFYRLNALHIRLGTMTS